jgi:hypothetical protein
MAESKNNIVIHGLSGKLGDILVFRQVAGRTIASKAPVASSAEPSAAQQAIRDKFQRAAVYGRTVVADPALKDEYGSAAPKGQTAYNVAIADFFNAPDILEIDVSGYTGQAGQQIKLKVTDDYKVKQVKVAIHNGDGSFLEEGPAVQVAGTADWVYTTKETNDNLAGDRITIEATDNPANLTRGEQALS